MRKTKFFLLAGTVLPALALTTPAFAEAGRPDAPIVLAQRGPDGEGGGGGGAERRQERQEMREQRQEQRQERRQERAEQPERARPERPERPERAEQPERARPERQERPERAEQPERARPERAEQPERSRPERAEQPERQRPDRAERQERQERPERQEQPDRPRTDKAEQPDRARPDRADPQGRDRPERPEQTDRQRPDRADQTDRERPDRAERPDRTAPERGAGEGGSLRDRMERDRAGDRDDAQQRREDRKERREDAKEKREDARDQRQDDRQQDRIDRLKDRNERLDDRSERLEDRVRDERRDARDDRDRLNGRIDKLKDERKERREGDRVIITEPGGRVIIREGGRTIIRRDETLRFRFGARDVREERRGGEIRTVVTKPDGSRIITVTDENGRLIRRVRESGGREYVLINNRPRGWRDGVFYNLDIAPPRVTIPRERYIVDADTASVDDIEEAFEAEPVARPERGYSLDEIRQSEPLRQYVRSVDLDSINFDTGSWEIRDDQISKLEKVGKAMESAIEENPKTVFLIEGHTDAVGSDDDNLSLSDRRAESVAEVLTKYFKVAAENLTTQGYGEQHLKVPTEGPEERNRRVSVRNITPLLSSEN